ncbi:hypothetical protein LUA82_03340 [Neoehrlichia mikurensis]|uniref:Uncharacterized protein n=1 Tax=Neoehrlichia mikurensis TaxID=89586 RepID=A0A9Q9F3Q0_9RICK|nr:hypothetical protein [Neoehrlichia mikurensis]UTO55203.1 hypothetical protein LUA82_03340 [Neoehrlichia mikurensis]UTO56123.1 hypothetical protein LUA81_03310 [Neoehrlichia mikurensis]
MTECTSNYYNEIISSITIEKLIGETLASKDILCGNASMQDFHRKVIYLNGTTISPDENRNLSLKGNIEIYTNHLINTHGILHDLQDICKMYNIDQKEFLEKCPKRYIMYVEYKKLFNTQTQNFNIKLINEIITNCHQGGLIGLISAKCINILSSHVNSIIKPDDPRDIHIHANNSIKTYITFVNDRQKHPQLLHNTLAKHSKLLPKTLPASYNNPRIEKRKSQLKAVSTPNNTLRKKANSYKDLSNTIKIEDQVLLNISHNENLLSQVAISVEYKISLQDNYLLYHSAYFTITIPDNLKQLIPYINNNNKVAEHKLSSGTKLIYSIGQAKISSQFQNLLSSIPKEINAFSFPITVGNIQTSPDKVITDTQMHNDQIIQYFK